MRFEKPIFQEIAFIRGSEAMVGGFLSLAKL